MLSGKIEQLEASLETAPTAEGASRADELAANLLSLSVDESVSVREDTVRGFLALYQHYYRLGEHSRANTMLTAAQARLLRVPSARPGSPAQPGRSAPLA